MLTVYRARDFDDAMQIVERIYAFIGAGHSVGLHTTRTERALELGQRLPVSRVIVNQVHCVATGGSFDNGLPFSLSMGCGTWGRNNFSDNMNYRHYLNITRVSTTIAERVPLGRRDLRRLLRPLRPRLSGDAHGPPASRRARRSLIRNATYFIAPHTGRSLTFGELRDSCVARQRDAAGAWPAAGRRMCRWCWATAFRRSACCLARCTAAIACIPVNLLVAAGADALRDRPRGCARRVRCAGMGERVRDLTADIARRIDVVEVDPDGASLARRDASVDATAADRPGTRRAGAADVHLRHDRHSPRA